MTDLISRADAIDAVAEEWLSEASAESPYVSDDDIGEYRKLAEKLFEDIPSADAVPIVYCMDCEKSVPLDEHGALWKCKAHDRTTLRHSYCNNGERKGVGDK